jgi:hypothetical protein
MDFSAFPVLFWMTRRPPLNVTIEQNCHPEVHALLSFPLASTNFCVVRFFQVEHHVTTQRCFSFCRCLWQSCYVRWFVVLLLIYCSSLEEWPLGRPVKRERPVLKLEIGLSDLAGNRLCAVNACKRPFKPSRFRRVYCCTECSRVGKNLNSEGSRSETVDERRDRHRKYYREITLPKRKLRRLMQCQERGGARAAPSGLSRRASSRYRHRRKWSAFS